MADQQAIKHEAGEDRSVLGELLATIPYYVFWKDLNSRYLGCNDVFAHGAGLSSADEIVGLTDFDMPWADTEAANYRDDDALVMSSGKAKLHIQESQLNANGQKIYVDTSKSPLKNDKNEVIGVIGIYADITVQKEMELQLAQTSKLESIGQLAAGVAHEINTPTQFVGDNTRFLEECFGDISPILRMAGSLAAAVGSGNANSELAEKLGAALDEADFEFLDEEIPRAISQTLEGIDRIKKIVQSLKEFSHPGLDEMTPVDLNHSIANTITVATNEWKYVAEVKTDFDSTLPMVTCFPGEISQVVLNLVVNASHAITDAASDGEANLGTITVKTLHAEGFAEVRIADTGTGIPEEVQGRVFDPFFTTKEVSKGTGQGLSVAYNIVVKRHGGTIDFETEIGKGTTFIVRLPLGREDLSKTLLDDGEQT